MPKYNALRSHAEGLLALTTTTKSSPERKNSQEQRHVSHVLLGGQTGFADLLSVIPCYSRCDLRLILHFSFASSSGNASYGDFRKTISKLLSQEIPSLRVFPFRERSHHNLGN